jgi:type I restriction enzyme S subunit
MSVTQNDGLVGRKTLGRKTDTALTPESHLLIHKGDIAYNMMRMWQGAFGLADEDGMVSPAYIVLSSKNEVDPRFASYWFKTPRLIHLFWAYSYGLTEDRLRLYFKDFAQIPITPPPLEKQKYIALVMSVWDEAISKLRDLIETKKKYKRYLTQQLLTGQIRFSHQTEHWNSYNLKELGRFSKGTGISKSEAVPNGLPAVRYGELYTTHHIVIKQFATKISPKVAKRSHRISQGDILIAGSGETPEEIGKAAAFLEDYEAYAGGDVVIFSPNQQKVDSLFLSYVINSGIVRRYIQSRAQGHSVVHLYRRDLEHLRVSIPVIGEQMKIAGALSSIDREIDTLESYTECLAQEKRGLMQSLLSDNIKRRPNYGNPFI